MASAPLPEVTLERLCGELSRDEQPSTPKSLPPDVNAGQALPASYTDYALRVIAAYARHLADALTLYLPLPEADRFHRSRAHIRAVSGSNRAGKTVCAGVETCRIARGLDPYEKRASRDQKIMVVGKDEKHLGQVIWNKLYFPGAFCILPDAETGLMRSVRPDPRDPTHLDPADLARRREWKPAPPLLPPDWIVPGGLAYAKKNQNIPAAVEGRNGTRLWFYTSKGTPRVGVDVDHVWADEQMVNQRWWPELTARIVDREGGAVWSTTPEDETPQFYNLLSRAESGDAGVEAFTLTIDANPYLSDGAKANLRADLAAEGDDILQVKYYGRPSIAGLSRYPDYDLRAQGVVSFDVPDEWMRVAVVDPGTQYAAGLFGAVPPDAHALYVYDELLVRNADAAEFARQFAGKCDGHAFEVYVIDLRAGRRRSEGRADTIAELYAREFRRARVPPARLFAGGFDWASDDVQSRILAVRGRLADGTLKFLVGRTHNLDQQIPRRFFKRDTPNTPEKWQKGVDLVDALEYLVAWFGRGLYHQPPCRPRETRTSGDIALYEEFLRERRRGGRARAAADRTTYRTV